jgi:hypothetical protein
MDYGADRWKIFLLSVSLMATASKFDVTRDASIVARWWSGRDRGWENAATAS